MSYDLAVWIGPTPLSDAEADAEFARRMDAMEEALDHGDVAEAPAPAIIAFVDAALARFPDLTVDSGDDCPWASGPLLGDAVGDLIYLCMTFSGADYARDELAEIASSLGLVCYDPQIESLLPDPAATPATDIHDRATTAMSKFIADSHRPSGSTGLLGRLFGRS